MWDFDYVWRGSGVNASFYYSYWDRGEELPLYYEGTGEKCSSLTVLSRNTKKPVATCFERKTGSLPSV